MRLARVITRVRDFSFALLAAILQVSKCHLPTRAWRLCVDIRGVMALMCDTKQAISEEKIGPVETGGYGLVLSSELTYLNSNRRSKFINKLYSGC